MSRRTISLILIVAGALLFILSLAADLIGIGSYPGFHGAQVIGLALGALVLILGLFFKRQKK